MNNDSITGLAPLAGFQVGKKYRYRLNGRSFVVKNYGVRTLELLHQIYLACATRENPNWPLSVRRQIRQLERRNARSLLSHVAERTNNPTLRVLAIWLRGRCGGSLGTSIVAKFSTDPDVKTRKEVARALKRMGAWAHLRKMVAIETDDQVRRMATAQPSKPYSRRLGNFSSHFPRLPIMSAKRELFVSSEFNVENGKPPNTVEFIRSILERIHRLVSGHSRR